MSSLSAPRDMRHFLVIWAGQVISLIGSGLTSFGLAVWIFQRTGEATPFALTALFGNLPRILLAPVAGVVADRWSRRWIMILADIGSALVTLAALFLLGSGQFAIWHIYLIALAGSVCGAFQEPAYIASITMLVPAKDLGRANGLVQLSQALEMLAAPIIAGALFPAVGLGGLITIDLITFGAAVGALLLIPVPQPPAAPRTEAQAGRQFWRDVAFGFRWTAWTWPAGPACWDCCCSSPWSISCSTAPPCSPGRWSYRSARRLPWAPSRPPSAWGCWPAAWP